MQKALRKLIFSNLELILFWNPALVIIASFPETFVDAVYGQNHSEKPVEEL